MLPNIGYVDFGVAVQANDKIGDLFRRIFYDAANGLSTRKQETL